MLLRKRDEEVETLSAGGAEQSLAIRIRLPREWGCPQHPDAYRSHGPPQIFGELNSSFSLGAGCLELPRSRRGLCFVHTPLYSSLSEMFQNFVDELHGKNSFFPSLMEISRNTHLDVRIRGPRHS